MTRSDAARGMALATWMALAFFAGASLATPERFGEVAPEQAERQLEQARGLRQTGQHERTIQEMREVVDRAPEYYRAQYNLGVALAERGRLDEALHALDRAVELKERKGIRDATIYNSIGWTHFLRGDYEQASHWLERAVHTDEPASDASRARALSNLGVVYMRQGQLEDAEEAFRQAGELGFDGAKSNLSVLQQAQRVLEAVKR